MLDDCLNPKQRSELFNIAGGTAGLLGYVAVGRGEFPLARAYCAEAFRLADFAENSNLRAWVRGLQSLGEYYAGNYGDALNLAEDGLAWAGPGPQGARLASNGVARAAGKLGDEWRVRSAVDAAFELLPRNDAPSGFPSSVTFASYSAAQVASNAATAFLSLCRPDDV